MSAATPGDEPAGEWIKETDSERVRAVLAERARGASLAEIGRMFGLSRESVRQIAMRKPPVRRRSPALAARREAWARARAEREEAFARDLPDREREVWALVEARRQRQARAAE